MTEELKRQIHYSNFTFLSDFVGWLNDLRDKFVTKRLTIKSVEDWLTQKGCFNIKILNGRPWKWLSQKGREFGIEAENKTSMS